MKRRILFFGLLIFQAAVILLIALQHSLIDDYGETIKLLRDKPDTHTEYYYDHSNYIYIQYEINKISEDIWEIDEKLDYGELVYVVLKPGESGIYNAVRVTKDKPEIVTDEIVIIGRHSYYDDMLKEYFVAYDIEDVENNQEYRLDDRGQWIITVKLAPWGQKSIVNMENMESE